MPPIYVSIANLKGGTGKTTLAAWLGYGLYRRGYRVLLVDLDPQAHLTGIFTLTEFEGSEEETGGVFDLLDEKEFHLRPIIRSPDSKASLDLLPSTINQYVKQWKKIADYPASGGEKRFRNEPAITKNYNYVIFDCPPDPIPARYGLSVSDYVIVPTDGSPLSIRGTRLFLDKIFTEEAKASKRLTQEPLKLLGIVPVKVKPINKRSLKSDPQGYILINYKKEQAIIKLSDEAEEVIRKTIESLKKHFGNEIYDPALFKIGLPQNVKFGDIVVYRLKQRRRVKGKLPIERNYDSYKYVKAIIDALTDEFIDRIQKFKSKI